MIDTRTILAGMLIAAAPAAMAADYPTKPITLVVGQAPGGGTDVIARIVAAELGEKLGTQVLVENRAGAGGNIGAEYAARARPDGYTLFLVTAPHAIGQTFYKNLNYSMDSFDAIGLVGEQGLLMMASPKLQVKSVREFAAKAAAEPGKYFYASAGNGSLNHLAGAQFARVAKLELQHVPYKGTPNFSDLVNGNVSLMFGNSATMVSYARSGEVPALAVTGSSRLGQLPNVPTLEELGYKGVVVANWFALVAPKGVSANIRERVSHALEEVLKRGDVKQRFQAQIAEPRYENPAQTQAFLRSEVKRWAEIIAATGAKMD